MESSSCAAQALNDTAVAGGNIPSLCAIASILDSILSGTECTCLYWVLMGKTSLEISNILAVSEHTANFHINNACAKLAARTRNTAAAVAMSMKMLEQIPKKRDRQLSNCREGLKSSLDRKLYW